MSGSVSVTVPEDSLLFVGGETRRAWQGRTFAAVDPATGRELSRVARAAECDVQAAVADCERAYREVWRDTPPAERARHLSSVAAAIEQSATELAVLESLDTGKPLHQASTDLAVAVHSFHFYATVAGQLSGETIPVGRSAFAFTTRDPYGVTGHILPWNYPIAIAARSIAPALAAGNCCVVKPAEKASLSVARFAQVALDAGLPPGVVNVVTGFGEEAGRALASHPGVRHTTFTGSVGVGRHVMQYAAQNVTPLVLELGGKSPHIVFDDANLAQAVPVIAASIIHNAGQCCTAGSRILIAPKIADDVISALLDAFAEITLGHGIEDPDMGPLISQPQLDAVLNSVTEASREGATVAAGGRRAQVPDFPAGHFCEPTLLYNVRPEQRIARSELFGPILCASVFRDDLEAVKIANSTDYGLAAAIWTTDIDRALTVANRLEVGQVFINTYGGGIDLPHGGCKHSGFGRLKGTDAAHEYSQIKSVAIAHIDPLFSERDDGQSR